MNTADLRAHAQSLLFAMEAGAPPAALMQKTQDVINSLGGRGDVRQMSTGSAALYLMVLLFSHLNHDGGH